MSIVTNLKNSFQKRHVKFRTLLIVTSIMLSVFFSIVYLGISLHNINEVTKATFQEEMGVEHNRFCDYIAECAYQVEKIETFVKRNGITGIVKENLELLDDAVAEERLNISQNRAKTLSISNAIIDSFLVVGKNENQKNLYFDMDNKELKEENFPTSDVIQESGLEGMLLANWGNIGKAETHTLIQKLNP